MIKKSRHPALIFIIIFSCIIAPGDARPSSPTDDIAAAVKLFKFGMYQKSYDVLLETLEEAPDNQELNFYLGRAAFEIGNYEMAVMAFERILIASPGEMRVKLEMARAFQRLGNNDLARRYCKEVLESNPPLQVRENIKKFLIHIDRSEQKHFISGILSLGVDWNNNVWASPATGKVKTLIGDITLTGDSAEKKQDWVYNTILVFSHTYRQPHTRDSWKTQAILYNGTYEETSDLDLRFAGLTTGYETMISPNDRIGLALLNSKTVLGAKTYMDSIGFKAYLDHAFTPSFLLNTTLRHEIKTYDDYPARDGDNTSLSATMAYLYKDTWLNARLNVEKEETRDDEYGYLRFGSGLSLTRELPFDFTGSLNFNFRYTTYKEASPLFSEKREDHQHITGCLLKKKIWHSEDQDQYIALNLNFQHTWNFSNIELYDYRTGLMQFFLTYNF